VEKRKILPLPRLELRPLRRPARSLLLYRLHYPGFHTYRVFSIKCYCLEDDKLMSFKYNNKLQFTREVLHWNIGLDVENP
jgi:hypothetical protein